MTSSEEPDRVGQATGWPFYDEVFPKGQVEPCFADDFFVLDDGHDEERWADYQTDLAREQRAAAVDVL